MFDILDLLPEDQVDKDRLRIGQSVEIALGAATQRLDAGKPRKCRTLHHMVANRERAGR